MTQQKTNIGPPPKKREKPVLPPQENESSNNLQKESSGTTVQMKFYVDQELRKEFQLYAIEHDMNFTELFIKAYEYYKQNNP